MIKQDHENKFGMFIHWGLYSITGLHEQALARYDIDSSEYESLANSFDPVDYDSAAWARLAREAGLEYGAVYGCGLCLPGRESGVYLSSAG